MTFASIILGWLLSTLYGAGFHLIVGGSARRLLLYLLTGWVSFAVGHVVGDWLNITVFNIGTLHVLSATIAAGVALFFARFIAMREEPAQ